MRFKVARTRWSWRWGAMLGGVALLACLPAAVGALPVASPGEPAARLLARVQASTGVPYQGYAESHAGLGLPDVPRASQVVALLGETTRMRAWVASPQSWRVDELLLGGERDLYHTTWGTRLWDSGRRRVQDIRGDPPVRFARPADLLPPELGRRLAAAAQPGEVRRIRGRRVAGVAAAGLEITPRSADTTVGHVDLWADPRTGLPLRVEVTARGASAPIVATAFLDLHETAPKPALLDFQLPQYADEDDADAPDIASAVDRFSPFVLPDALGGEPRRSRVASAAGSYGQGFDLVAVLALPARFSPRDQSFIKKVPTVTGPWGDASLVQTPILNGMVFESGDVGYVLAGTVRPQVLERVAAQLAAGGVGTRAGT